MNTGMLMLVLVVVAASFAGAGVLYALRVARGRGLEDYTTARGSIGGGMAALTLFASGMGGWLLFSPAEAATWGGVPNLVGYAVGSALPLLVFMQLGLRMRRLMPEGHTLTEYVFHRYGAGMCGFTLVVMIFYMFIFLAAEVTGMALIVQLVAGVPLWLTALVVLAAVLAYTTLGGLRASIFTDGVQAAFILPLLAVVVGASLAALGGVGRIVEGVAERAPHLLDPGFGPGIEGALTLIIGIAAANVFDQGYWQRVYAVRDERALRTGFLLAAVLVVPVVLVMGLYGLAAVAFDQAQAPSVALFSVLLGAVPAWVMTGLVVLGLLLVMSSADTIINGIASLVAVDGRRWAAKQPNHPEADTRTLLRFARWSTIVLAVPAWLVAAQGYSVLYLFLLADLICAAALVPVFTGLFTDRYDGRAAVWSTIAGLMAGGLLFPDPSFSHSLLGWLFGSVLEGSALAQGNLLWAFVAALLVPVGVSWLLRPREAVFDRRELARRVHVLAD